MNYIKRIITIAALTSSIVMLPYTMTTIHSNLGQMIAQARTALEINTTYKTQKQAIKDIKKTLKATYKNLRSQNNVAWVSAKDLYKQFKKLVYKYWKKTRTLPTI